MTQRTTIDELVPGDRFTVKWLEQEPRTGIFIERVVVPGANHWSNEWFAWKPDGSEAVYNPQVGIEWVETDG